MASQASIQQSTVQVGRQADLLASHSAAEARSTADGVRAAEEKHDEHAGTSTAQVGGAGVLIAAVAIIVAVFGVGFIRTRVERGLGRSFERFVDAASGINVPLLLPLTIAETIREVLAGRRDMVPPTGE